jgi:hypothetical protein
VVRQAARGEFFSTSDKTAAFSFNPGSSGITLHGVPLAVVVIGQ